MKLLSLIYNKSPKKVQYIITQIKAMIRRTTKEGPIIKEWQARNLFLEKQLKGKRVLKVVFFVFDESIWKYDELFRLMINDNRFSPTLVISPFAMHKKEHMIATQNRCANFFADKGYYPIKGYDDISDKYLDVKEEISPDIIFFSSPYDIITHPLFNIKNFTESLSCFTTYGYTIDDNRDWYDLLFHNIVWKFFMLSDEHQKIASRYLRNNGTNTFVTGATSVDEYLYQKPILEDPWKIKDREIKRIIYAPHHSIEPWGYSLSTFMEYGEWILEYAEQCNSNTQFAFKPHPHLRDKLNKHKLWGLDKTNRYFNRWNELPNTILAEGNYVELFQTSDAIIHDCCSFTVEYLYTHNPAMFLFKQKGIKQKFNIIGERALKAHYEGRNKKDIITFIEETVSKGEDPLYEDRNDVFEKYLLPPNNNSASQNIINHILEHI